MKRKSGLILAVFIGLVTQVNAQTDREAFHQALEACASELGIERPTPGQRPSEEERSKIDACLSSKGITPREHKGNSEFRDAMDACFTETDVKKPEQGVRPSDEDRAKIEACLESKGISKPEKRNRSARASAQ